MMDRFCRNRTHPFFLLPLKAKNSLKVVTLRSHSLDLCPLYMPTNNLYNLYRMIPTYEEFQYSSAGEEDN